MTRLLFCFLPAAAFLLIGCQSYSSREASDLDRVQGKWALLSAQRDGVPSSGAEIKNSVLTVQGNRFSFSPGSTIGTSASGTFEVHPETHPKSTESVSSSGERSLGIYKFEGPYHWVCFAPPGKPRPDSFSSPRGSGWILQQWKRIDQ